MVDKVEERIIAEEAAKLLAVDWEIIDIPEPPDFEIRSDGEILGLEIREIFIDGEAAHGSPLRKAESDHRALVRAVARRYYDAGGTPLYVKILGRLSRSSLDEVVQTLLSLTLNYAVSEPPSNDVVAKVAGVKLFLKPLPASFENYSRWVLLTDQVGWVREVTIDDLQQAIEKKASRLRSYRDRYERTILLLVANRRFRSGKIGAPASTMPVDNPGFSSIYFMSRLESITRVA